MGLRKRDAVMKRQKVGELASLEGEERRAGGTMDVRENREKMWGI